MKKSLNILIVEDNKAEALGLKSILEKDNESNVKVIYDGKRASEYIIENNSEIDVIVLDQHLPSMNGFEIMDELNTYNIDHAIIFITHDDSSDVAVRALKSGAFDFISKSKDMNEYLPEAIKNVGLRHDNKREKIKHEHELEVSEHHYKVANNAKDMLFSIIAHDLKNPFNQVINITDLIIENIETYDKDSTKEMLLSLNRYTRNAYTILENLLLWSKSQRHLIELKETNVCIKDVLDSVTKLYEGIAEDKEVEMISDIKEKIYIRTDMNIFQTVLRNLIYNAIKFTPHSGKVSVSCSYDEELVKIYVRDTGVGISKKRLNNLFNLSEYISSNGTNGESGSGFGLVLCKELLDICKAKITVESKENEGSSFCIEFKRALVETNVL